MTEFEQRRETVNSVAQLLLLDTSELLDFSPEDVDEIVGPSLDNLSVSTIELFHSLKSRNGSGVQKEKVYDAASFLLFASMDELEVIWLTYRSKLPLPPGFRAYWMLVGRKNRELPEEERLSSEQVRSDAVNSFKGVPPEHRVVHAALEANISSGKFDTRHLPTPMPRPKSRPRAGPRREPMPRATPVGKPEQEPIDNDTAVASLIKRTAAAAVAAVVQGARERALAEEAKQQRALDVVITLNKDAAKRRAAALKERERLSAVEERVQRRQAKKPIKPTDRKPTKAAKMPVPTNTSVEVPSTRSTKTVKVSTKVSTSESVNEPTKESIRLRKAAKSIAVRIAARVIQKSIRSFLFNRKLAVAALEAQFKKNVKPLEDEQPEKSVEPVESPVVAPRRKKRLPALTPCWWGAKCNNKSCRFMHETPRVNMKTKASQPQKPSYEPSTSTLDDDSRLCCVCLTEEKNTAALACKHLCVCECCSKTLSECPICRTPSDFLTMFL